MESRESDKDELSEGVETVKVLEVAAGRHLIEDLAEGLSIYCIRL